MRTHLSRKGSCEGGMLVVTLVVCAVVGVMLTAYLSMVSGRHGFTQRSQVWNNCIPMCEAGVEDALAHLNHSLTTSNFAVNGWWKTAGSYYKNPVNLNGGSYDVSINSNYPPIITSTGRLVHPITGAQITRAVRVQTKINQRFPNAILTKGLVDLGGAVAIDSFNSTNALESSPTGQYDPAKHTDRASVATVSKTPGDFRVGNAVIYGSAGTGPGGDIIVGANGNVGSTAFNDNPAYNGQIEPLHSTDDVNVYIPDVTFPSPFGPIMPVGPGIYPLVGGTNYTILLNNADYRVPSVVLGTGQKVCVVGKVRVHVTGNTVIGGDAFIYVVPGSTIEYYSGGSFDLSGSGVVNYPGFAKNFSVFGMSPGCTTVKYGGSAKFVGTIYAPSANITLTGTTEAMGAFVGKTLRIVGTMNVHYDEALKGDPKEGKFLAASWREL